MGKKILLADDSITIQKVIELTFSDEDFEVVTVGNGRLAIEKVQEVRPDVVLCDIIMPEKDGYEVCDFVKKNAALSHIPVLLLTGAFEPFDQERASRVGCDGFLAKPFEPQALIAKVKDLLRQAEVRQPAGAAPAAVAPPPPPPPAPPPSTPESSSATIWAAPSPVVSPVWEPPQTRPAWTPIAPVAPPPAAEEPGVHFIPEDPFTEEASGFVPATGEPMQVPSFPEETFGAATEVEPEPYVLEPAAVVPDELLPMTADEEQSLAPEPMGWDPPAAPVPAAAPPGAAAPAPSERDLFLEEVFDEAAAAVEAAHAAHARVAAPAPEPQPEPAPAPAAVADFEPHALQMETAVNEPAERVEAVAPEPVAAEPEPEPEPPAAEEAAPIAAPALVGEPAPVPEPAPAVAAAPPEPAPAPPVAVAPPPAAEELELEAEESFASVAPPAPEPPDEPAPSEAGAVTVPMDMVSQIAQRVVAQISEKVIREIAWEVIPDMAEALIKREIERLTAELQQS